MLIEILLGVNSIIGVCALGGIVYNAIKTKVLMTNHLAHLAKNVKLIFIKLEKIDKTQVTQDEAMVGIKNTCKERKTKK